MSEPDYKRQVDALKRKVEVLETENDTLRATLESLKKAFYSTSGAPSILGLTKSEALILGVLMSKKAARKDDIMAIYAAEFSSDDVPEEKIIDVFVCKMRKKLTPFGIVVATIWGDGWMISPEHKEIIRDLIKKEGE